LAPDIPAGWSNVRSAGPGQGESRVERVLFGEAGPVAIVPLKRGADGNLGIASSGPGGSAGNVTVNVINAPAGVESQRTTTDAQGNTRIDVTLKTAIDGAVGDSLSAGTGRRVLASQYGVRQFTRS
jgi:phage-related minor tail protein